MTTICISMKPFSTSPASSSRSDTYETASTDYIFSTFVELSFFSTGGNFRRKRSARTTDSTLHPVTIG
jgi:hypothetical protein